MAHQHETILRQWQMLRYIPRYPAKISARTLKERLDADGFVISKRTIERDLIQLSLSFPLFQDDRDKQYGWSWQKDAPSFDLPALSNNEALTMVMVEQHLTGLLPVSTTSILAPYFASAHKQLDANAQSNKFKSWIDKVRTVQPNQTLIAPSVNPEVQAIVSEALLSDKQLKIEYKNRDGETKQYKVHLLALVQRGGLTYLSVRINNFEDLRMLAMHRITSAEILNEATDRPNGFNIDDEIAKGSFDYGQGDLIKLKATFTNEAGKHLLETPLSDDQSVSSVSATHFDVEATVANTPQLMWWLLALGAGVEVKEPNDLRSAILETLKSAFDNYK